MTEIIRARKDHIGQVAVIHKRVFPDHFLGMLPTQMLFRFYDSFLCDDVVFLVSVDGGAVSGFVMGGFSSSLNECMQRFIRKNAVGLGLSIVCNPKIYPMAFDRLKGLLKAKIKRKKQRPEDSNPGTRRASLLSIGVAEEFHGTGIARRLTGRFEECLMEIGVTGYSLSVRADNPRARGFYLKTGFAETGDKDGLVYYSKTL